MFYQRYTEQSDNPKWGGATYLFETDEANIPIRQLAVYQNGKINKYDKTHTSDEDGKLSEKPLFLDDVNRKEWRRYKIGKRSFEKAWKRPESVPADPYKDAVKAVHVAGIWTIVLGLCTAAGGMVLALLALRDQALSHAAQQNSFAFYVVITVIPGMVLNSLGVLLRVTRVQTLSLSLKWIGVVMLLIAGVPLLSLLTGGNGSGLLGLIVFLFLVRAQRKIVRLGFRTSTKYKVSVLMLTAVILLAGALALSHLKTQLDSEVATPTESKPAKQLVGVSAARSLATATSLAQAEQALQTFGAQYNVKIEISDTTPSATFKSNGAYVQLSDADLPALKNFGAFFIDEWAKYPTDWVKHSQLQSIVLVKNLTVNKNSNPATADPDAGVLYYDAGFLSNAYLTNSTVTRQLIHETFFSLITHNDFNSYTPADPKWQALNASGFSYGPSSYCQKTENTPDCMGREHPMAGFVNDHATTSLQEDKSQLYGYLMTAASFKELEKWLPKDTQLTDKTQALIGYISHHSPEMEGNYFTDINP